MELFYILLFLVALLYAVVGHGGASGYLALMAVYEVAPEVMKPTALLLNLFVSFISFWQYYRSGHFQERIFIPLAAASIPLSFFGGTITLDEQIYHKVLGVLLLIPVFRFVFFPGNNNSGLRGPNTAMSLLIGGSIGFVSGMIGIGGGIILSPVLLLLRWTDQKKTAAVSALFIFVNSLAGLGGQFSKGLAFSHNMLLYVAVAFAGGMLGSYLGALKFRQETLKNILAFVLLIAACKLLFV